ncbi:MAG: AMP-binding protein [Proteobacteria bacterium]|nr:AMP-binding protein [Pseudomonadota bacterium]
MSKGSLSVGDQLAGKRLLVMGGTGFLGKVWLSMVLKRFRMVEHIYLVCRVRKNRDGSIRQDSEARFWAEVATSPTMDPLRDELGQVAFEALMREKITAIAGDVSEPFAGVTEELRDEIRGSVHAVVNSAGIVDFQPPLDYALNANAFGMQNLIQLCEDLGPQCRMLHTSTCYVAGDRTGQVDEVDPLDYPFPKADELDVNHWSPQREIDECLDMVEHVRHRSNDAYRQSEFLDAAKQNLRDKGEPARGSALKDELEKVKRKFVEDRLRDDGTERAKFWGWHNTYTYTKSIGEQLLCTSGVTFTIVRPAVIESAVGYPRVGWCEGINTSAPLIYLAMQGPISYPTMPDAVLDVIPVDMVAAGMILGLAELLEGTHDVVYQLGSSDTSPLSVPRLIELVGLWKRRYRLDDGADGPVVDWIQSRIEPLPTSVDAYRNRGPKYISGWLEKGSGMVKSIGGPLAAFTGPASTQLKGLAKNLDISSRIIDQFVPFIATHNYRFSCANTRGAFDRLSPEEQALVPWHPETIDWRHYITEVHAPGIRENVAPEIDAKLQKEAKPLRKHDTLLDLLDEIAERHELAPALLRAHDDGFARISFQQMQDLSSSVAVRLVAAGLKPGARVLISGANHPDWPISYFGILKAGGIAVPVDPAMMPEQVANIVDVAEVRMNLVDAEARETFGEALKGTILDLNEVADRGPTGPLPEIERDPNAVASILFTSGTTGLPKGVMLTHENFTSLLASLGKIFPLRESDRVLSVLPLHHTFEFSCGLLLPLSRGARVIYLDEIDGERLSWGLKEGKVTGMVGVPALWQLLERRIRGQVSDKGPLFESGFDAGLALNRWIGKTTGLDVGKLFFGQVHDRLGGNIRFLISGAAALPKETQELFKGLGLHLAEGYGLTEAAPVLTVAKGKPGAKAGHVGKPIPGVKIKVVNKDKDGVGEVWAKGPNVMYGYYGNEKATQETLDADGWLHTGDLGKIDHAGRLTIMGRAKEVVVTASGENIYLDDVENVLGPNHDYVKEFALVGIEDARGGERLGMLLVPDAEENKDLDRHTLHARAKDSIQKAIKKLPGFQRPAILHVVDADLPRTASRKVKRKDVRKVLQRIVDAVPKKTGKSQGIAGPLAQAIATVGGIDVKKVTPNAKMAELGFDSLMWVELAAALEHMDGGRPDPDDLAKCETVADVIVLARAPKPQVVEEEDPRDTAIQFPDIVAEPLKQGLGFFQRELYGTGLNTKIYGRAFIPQNRQTIVVCNHCSHLDMGLVKYALGPYGHKLVALAAQDYFFEGNPWVVAYFEQLTNLRPIDRKRGFRASLNQASDVVREGHIVLIFPEGTRRTDGTIGEFKPLVARLALDTNVDILPMFLDGTFDAMPKGAVVPRSRDLSVRIGPPLEMRQLRRMIDGLKPADGARKVAAMAQQAVEALRDGQVLDLQQLQPDDIEMPGTKVNPTERAFSGLAARFEPERFKKETSWYFTLGGQDGLRYTVTVSSDGATVATGKPSGGKADCVVKTSQEMLRKIIEDAYVPEPPEFFSGVIKTNDIPLLIEFSRVFKLSEVNL